MDLSEDMQKDCIRLGAMRQAIAMWRKISGGYYHGIDTSSLIAQGEKKTLADLEEACFNMMCKERLGGKNTND